MKLKSEFVLSFDLPREYSTAKVRMFGQLRKIRAKMVHESFWKHDDFNKLMEVAITIKKFQGRAGILEERLVF